MRLPGRRRVRLAWRWARSRLGTRGVILGYHRVDEVPRDPYGLRVSPSRFEEHLEVLRRCARPLPLAELVRRSEEDRLPRGAVAVTFDDGYAELSSEALPRLERHGIPATVFVISDLLGTQPWWEVLARAVLAGGDGPSPAGTVLRRPTGGVEFGDRVPDDGPAELLGRLYRGLAALSSAERRVQVDRLARTAGLDDDASEGTGPLRLLAPEEVRRLAGNGHVEVGAHSATHPDLTTLEDGGREEVERSLERLRELLERPVVAFSYPHGRTSPRVVETVRRAGVRWACTSRNDVVRAGSDPHRLPRFWPGDWEGERFARWLRVWLGG